MRVSVRLSEPLRTKAGCRQVTLNLDSNQVTMLDVLSELSRQCPGLADELDKTASLVDANYCAFHNIRMVQFVDADKEAFHDGDELSIYLPLVGGQPNEVGDG